MLTIAFLALAMVILYQVNNSQYVYSCPQCGSKNGKHMKHCSFDG